MAKAVTYAYKAVMEEAFPVLHRKMQQWWIELKILAPGFAIGGLIFSIFAVWAPVAKYFYEPSRITLFGFLALTVAVASALIGALVFVCLGIVFSDMNGGESEADKKVKKDLSAIPLKKCVLLINPVTGFMAVALIPLALAVAGIYFLIKGLSKIPWRKTVLAIGKFFRLLFVAIHGDDRVLCFFYAAVGSIAGYLSGRLLVGIVIAAIFGMITHEATKKLRYKLGVQPN